MIDAPGFTFDTTAPTFTRANNLTLRQHGHAKRMRVRYRLPTATDPGGDALQVACTPRSGSMFKTGTTIVHCAATDNNGNTATTTFAIAIKPSRR